MHEASAASKKVAAAPAIDPQHAGTFWRFNWAVEFIVGFATEKSMLLASPLAPRQTAHDRNKLPASRARGGASDDEYGTLFAMSLDYIRLSADWLRALRGTRSQLAMSRWLGYRTNIAYRWESGQCSPSAAVVFDVLEKQRHDLRDRLMKFYRSSPAWLEHLYEGKAKTGARDLPGSIVVPHLLNDLRGAIPVVQLARAAGYSRFAVSRWLKGASQPSLPQFLGLLDTCSGRVLDFVACFTDPASLESARAAWTNLLESRELAYGRPWSQGVLTAMSLTSYKSLVRHDPAWIAQQLGADVAEVTECIDILKQTGQLTWDGRHYRENAPRSVDTRADEARARHLRAWWLRIALGRLVAGDAGLFSYNVGAVSDHDLRRLQHLQRSHYRELRQIIARSEPAERVVYYGAQFFALDGRGLVDP